MGDVLFGLVFWLIYFGSVIYDTAKGAIHFRGGIVVRKRDNPYAFWLAFGIAMGIGILMLAFITAELWTPIIPGIFDRQPAHLT